LDTMSWQVVQGGSTRIAHRVKKEKDNGADEKVSSFQQYGQLMEEKKQRAKDRKERRQAEKESEEEMGNPKKKQPELQRELQRERQREKEREQEEMEAAEERERQRQLDIERSKNQPKGPTSFSCQEIVSKISLNKISPHILELEKKFKNHHEIHLSALVEGLESHTSKYVTHETHPEVYLPDFVNSEVSDFIIKRIHATPDKELQPFFLSICIASIESANNVSKDPLAHGLGRRLLIQYIVKLHARYLESLTTSVPTLFINFRSTTPVAQEIAWIFTQAIHADCKVAIDAWKKLLLPSLNETGTAAHSTQVATVEMLIQITQNVPKTVSFEKRCGTYEIAYRSLSALAAKTSPLNGIKREAELKKKTRATLEALQLLDPLLEKSQGT